MATLAIHEPHALTRLRERYALELTEGQLRWLAKLLGDPATRSDHRWFRLLMRLPDGSERWRVNLQQFGRRGVWAVAIYDPRRCNVVTFYGKPERKGATNG